MKLVNMLDLGSSAEMLVGSSPTNTFIEFGNEVVFMYIQITGTVCFCRNGREDMCLVQFH